MSPARRVSAYVVESKFRDRRADLWSLTRDLIFAGEIDIISHRPSRTLLDRSAPESPHRQPRDDCRSFHPIEQRSRSGSIVRKPSLRLPFSFEDDIAGKHFEFSCILIARSAAEDKEVHTIAEFGFPLLDLGKERLTWIARGHS
jgi:hypothetical protein